MIGYYGNLRFISLLYGCIYYYRFIPQDSTYGFCIIPYLFVLHQVIEAAYLLSNGIRVALVSVAYLWIVFGVCKLLKSRKLIASAAALILAIPLHMTINAIVKVVLFDPWNLLSMLIIALTAAILFATDIFMHRK